MKIVVCMLLLLPLTVLSTVTDAQKNDGNEQNLSWQCGDKEIVATLVTPFPFEGTLMTAGGSKNQCAIHGNGNTTTHLSISLVDLDLCNVTYDQILDKYSVRIWSRSHSKLLLDSDRFYDIHCQGGGKHVISPPTPENQFWINFESADNAEIVKDLIFGRPYTLSVHQMRNSSQPFLVTKCTAKGDTNLSATVIDSRGCPSGSPLLSAFSRSSDNAISTSIIPSMFRFSSTKTLTFECAIQICGQGESCKPFCSNANAQDRVRSLLSTAEDEEDLSEEMLVVSTTVTVEDDLTTDASSAEKSEKDTKLVVPIQENICRWKNEEIFVYAWVILGAGFLFGTLFNLMCCYIWMRKRARKREMKVMHRKRIDTDYWIAEPANSVPKNVSSHTGYYETTRRLSNASYASVKNRPTRPAPPIPHRDYGVPAPSVPAQTASIHASQLSDYAGSRASSDGREYASCGVTGSTFLSHSTTVETDLDSPGSNQTVSYH